jgi:hypothetical protein
MKDMYPTLACSCAALVAICYLFGFETGMFGLMVPTMLLAVAGLIWPGQETPISGRVSAVLALILGATPFLAPIARDLRVRHLESVRARETKHQYETLTRIEADLRDKVRAFSAANGGALPEFDHTGALLPSQGVPPGSAAPFEVPEDPFSSGAKLRWATIPGKGAFAVSNGQDGKRELLLPAPAMDRMPPGDPLAMFAATGQDPRDGRYLASEGPLGLGDIVLWLGDGSFDDAIKPLEEAWNLAKARSPLAPEPPRANAMDMAEYNSAQSASDAREATTLLREGKNLAALALASRALTRRPEAIATWKPDHFRASSTRAIALYRLGHLRSAADAFMEHLTVAPNDVEAHYYLGCILGSLKDTQRAKLHLSAASQLAFEGPIGPEADARLGELERGEALRMPQ